MCSDKFYAFIPARAGSKGIPGKNIKMMAGKSLVRWVIDAAINAKNIDKIIISTDIDCIFDWKLSNKVEVIKRPKYQANDIAQLEPIMVDYAKKNNNANNHMILLQPTSPMLQSGDIDGAINLYDYHTSVLSGYKSHQFFYNYTKNSCPNSVTPSNYNPFFRPRRQDWGGCCVENGAIYINSFDNIIRDTCRLSGWNIGLYEMPMSRSFEVDRIDDWNLIESLLLRKNNTNEKANNYEKTT